MAYPMAWAQALNSTPRPALAPHPFAGAFADQVLSGLDLDLDRSLDHGQRILIERVLNYAVNAEQKIAEQQARISELESLSMTDDLTGLANRRGLMDFMRRALADALRHDKTGMFAYLDLDGFKQTNDSFGHEAGDRVLIQVAEILARNVRDGDFVARLGGDEFVVVLTQVEAGQGRRKLRQLQRLLFSEPLPWEGTHIPIRASVGIEAFDGQRRLEDILHCADTAMYREKRGQKADFTIAAE